jgi:hypothetical protein
LNLHRFGPLTFRRGKRERITQLAEHLQLAEDQTLECWDNTGSIMLRRPYEVFEQAACTLARSARPIQQRLSDASSIIGELRPDDFGNYRELRDVFENLTDLLRKGASRDWTQMGFPRLSDEEAEQLAANVFDAFLDVAKTHLSTRQ